MLSVLLAFALQAGAQQADARDAGTMMDLASKRLSAQPNSSIAKDYRVVDDDDGVFNDPTSKDRAFADNGTKCAVVGAKRCTSKPRTIFSTAFD